MKIFISYAWEDVETAEGLAIALRNDGHNVFFDRSLGRGRGLKPGAPVEKTIREQIWSCELFLFLASTEALERGSYARAELRIVQGELTRKNRQILPVLLRPTSIEFPPFLRVGLLQPEGDVIAEVCAEVAAKVRLSRRRRRRLATLALLVLAVASLAGILVWFYWIRTTNRLGKVETTTAVTESEKFFRQQAAAAGYTQIEIVDSWVGDFMIDHPVERSKLVNFLRSKAATNQHGDFLIGVWHPDDSSGQSHSWLASATLTEAGTRPQILSPYATIHSPGLEAKDGAYRVNTGGLSVVGWALVLGSYTKSFDDDVRQWICTNFTPRRAPIVDSRVPTEGSKLYTLPAPNGCPPQKFLGLTTSNVSEIRMFRANLNLPMTADEKIPETDTVFITVTKNQDAKPFAVRAALIWAGVKQ